MECLIYMLHDNKPFVSIAEWKSVWTKASIAKASAKTRENDRPKEEKHKIFNADKIKYSYS